ncbi:MAG: M1 family metallopeptidase [Gemmatimonadetes bacterium]|nr:M1 family metallopeptidase [Gemmatimonadota bacterium]
MIRTATTTLLATLALAAGVSGQQPAYHPFQQGVRYVIEATQDDATSVLTGRARLSYENRAPESLNRLYFHQYLNAFRPNSAWARYDLRFDNRTFQDLGPEDHAFERITAFLVDGRRLEPVYPFAPDSTVFYVELPRPLATGESVEARIDWTARLATEPRRQGRRGRHYDWAHWYPRIAVYGADGWEYRSHIRPGELNGTFGTYDVTLELPRDQVLGATGVVVEGDPGWAAAAVPGSAPVAYGADVYRATAAPGLDLLEPYPAAGRKKVRWHAEDVHNFAWSTSPAYRYRGDAWNGTLIHLLWEPSSEGWDPDRIMERQKVALEWVEEIFGEYPWPQITVTDRVERGATEFPMLYMTSGGAVVHETMHMVAHGVLANNEWKQGWLDEGMASFLTSWLEEERGADLEKVWGGPREYIARLDAAGRSERVALPGAEFSSYQMYSTMTYAKGSLILRMLRDMLGEEVFREGLRAYYERHRFSQVTEADFRRAMEDVSGRDLGWFFDQWLRTTDTLDYVLRDVDVLEDAGGYTITAEVVRRGEAWMPVVLEAGDARRILDSRDRAQTVTLRSATRPDAVMLDPAGSLLETTRDNNRRPVR